MIKIFFRDDRINFVDDNNKFIGYEYRDFCCECFGWKIKNESDETIVDDEHDNEYFMGNRESINTFIKEVDGYEFSGKMERINPEDDHDHGGMMKFELVSKEKPTLFLCLYNYHNGFYYHEFNFKDGDKEIHSECL